jgi:hypothetical protein
MKGLLTRQEVADCRAVLDQARAHPEAAAQPRQYGTIASLWNAVYALTGKHMPSLPAPLAAFDRVVELTQIEAIETLALWAAAHEDGANDGFREHQDFIGRIVVELSAQLAQRGFYTHLTAIWFLLHWINIEPDHEAVMRLLRERSGDTDAELYLKEAMDGTMILKAPMSGAVVVSPAIQHAH